MLKKEEMITLLKNDVVPALGCTEPVCVALCAANAGKMTENKIRSIEVEVNAGIYKNGMSAGIPGCDYVGLPYAAALGAYLKNPEKGLELLEDITPEILEQMTIAQIRQVADTASEEELHFLMDGVEMNERLAAYSEDKKVGVGIADTLRSEKGSEVLKNDLLTRIMLKVSSAAESRLDGCPLPTMSSSGAGTKGLVVILPVSEAADALGVSMEKKVRALAIAHLVNRYINAYIGKLSPMCSCVMASSTAASVGIAYLLGGSDEQLGYAVRNMSGTVTGMICDGGKVGCAMKVATGSSAALLCALTAVHDAPLRVSDGICAETPEDCIRHMAQIGNQGMAQTDKEIIHIMEQKK